jgi:hypothetical protein
VIYFDGAGVLRKEKSWEGWRDKGIEAQEYVNSVPLGGFVLNRGVGGGRGWDGRNEYIRVWDPRGFEVEISVANLLYILQEGSSIKGKGLEGEFVYAWRGTELILLPVGSKEYQESVTHTERQGKVVSGVIAGNKYITKEGTEVIYLGKLPYYRGSGMGWKGAKKEHIYVKVGETEWYRKYIIGIKVEKLAEDLGVGENYGEELEGYQKSVFYGEIVGVEVEDMVVDGEKISYRGNYIIEEGGKYYVIRVERRWHSNDNYEVKRSIEFVPMVVKNSVSLPEVSGYSEGMSEESFNKLRFVRMMVVTKYGTKVEVRL